MIIILRNCITSFDSFSKWPMAAVLTGRMNYSGDDTSEVSDTESDDDQVIFITHTTSTYVILHVRNATVNQHARGQTDARTARKITFHPIGKLDEM